jgi:hypothetical protein
VSSLLAQSSKRFSKLPVGSQIEVSPDAYRIARKVGELLQCGKEVDGKPSVGGCGLIVDYGGAKPFEDSLRVGSKVTRESENSFDKISLRRSKTTKESTCSTNLENATSQPT